jgi:hypothetical protein
MAKFCVGASMATLSLTVNPYSLTCKFLLTTFLAAYKTMEKMQNLDQSTTMAKMIEIMSEVVFFTQEAYHESSVTSSPAAQAAEFENFHCRNDQKKLLEQANKSGAVK